MSDAIEMAWAAGLFEGEGFIGFNRSLKDPEKRPRGYLTLELRMTDEDVVRRFAAVVGIGSVNGPYIRAGQKPFWGWRTSGRVAEGLMANERFAGLLGIRRTNRLAEVREILRTQPPPRHRGGKKTACPRGHDYTPENTFIDKAGVKCCIRCKRKQRLASYHRCKVARV